MFEPFFLTIFQQSSEMRKRVVCLNVEQSSNSPVTLDWKFKKQQSNSQLKTSKFHIIFWSANKATKQSVK